MQEACVSSLNAFRVSVTTTTITKLLLSSSATFHFCIYFLEGEATVKQQPEIDL